MKFTLQCFHDDREKLFENVQKINNKFIIIKLSNEQKFVWLISSEQHDTISLFATFLYNAYNKRTNLVTC